MHINGIDRNYIQQAQVDQLSSLVELQKNYLGDPCNTLVNDGCTDNK